MAGMVDHVTLPRRTSELRQATRINIRPFRHNPRSAVILPSIRRAFLKSLHPHLRRAHPTAPGSSTPALRSLRYPSCYVIPSTAPRHPRASTSTTPRNHRFSPRFAHRSIQFFSFTHPPQTGPMAQYGYGQSPGYGQQNPQNLQFYSSSFSNQPVSGHSTPFQAGYGAPAASSYPAQYGAGFAAPGVTGQMGVGASGLRTGWLAAFGTEGWVT